MKLNKTNVKNEYIIGLVVVLVFIGGLASVTIVDYPSILAEQWIRDSRDGYYSSCAMEAYSRDDFENKILYGYNFSVITTFCKSASDTTHVFSYKLCSRCPGYSCAGTSSPEYMLTDHNQILMVYLTIDPMSYFENFRIKYCKDENEIHVDDLKYCDDADDCVAVGCHCYCHGGGGFAYADVVNKEYEDYWYMKRGCEKPNKCLAMSCPPRYIACENNICVVKEGKELN